MKKITMEIKSFYMVLAVGIIVIIGVGLSTAGYFSTNTFTGWDNINDYSDGWTDEKGNELDIPYNYHTQAGQDFVMEKLIDKDMRDDTCILFRTDHTFVKAYLNGEQIYKFGEKEEIPFGKTPGSGWQLIPLNGARAGDVLTIVTNCPYEKYSGLAREILTGTKAELCGYIMWSGIEMLIIIFIPLLIGVFTILIPPFFFKDSPVSNFVNIGLAFINIAIWSFTEARTWQLFFTNQYIMQTVNFITFSMIVPSILLSMRVMGFIKNMKLYKRAMLTDCIIPAVVLILQLLNVADFFDTLILIHGMILVNAFMFAFSYMKNVKKDKGMSRILSILLYPTIALCAVLDLLDFYVWDRFGNGFFTRLELFILMMASGLVAIRRAWIIHRENVEKEAYEKMAYTDTLTGFRNRRGFNKDIEAIEKENRQVTIVYMDMNGLKRINDEKGHYMGDKALQIIGEHIGRFQNKETTCYRLGGDEFCVLSFDREPKEAETLCEDINKELERFINEFDYVIGISYGIIKYMGKENMNIQRCISEADRRMYIYKEEVYKHQSKYR